MILVKKQLGFLKIENGNIINQGGPYNDNTTINETFNVILIYAIALR